MALLTIDLFGCHVLGQEEAKRALSVAVCDHYNWARRCLEAPELGDLHHVKPNVLLLGPSGVGKTHLMRALAKLLGVPFAKADSTKFSATGYVGADVDEIVRGLVPAANGDVGLAEMGIVYVDEVDKLAEDGRGATGLFGGGGGGVNTKDVQCALLKLMEDAEVPLQASGSGGGPGGGFPPRLGRPSPLLGPNFGPSSVGGAPGAGGAPPPSVLRTRHVLFVFSGAFTQLDASLQQQHKARQPEPPPTPAEPTSPPVPADKPDVLHLAGTADFVRHGLEPEFIGRIPIRVACQRLREDDLYKVRATAPAPAPAPAPALPNSPPPLPGTERAVSIACARAGAHGGTRLGRHAARARL